MIRKIVSSTIPGAAKAAVEAAISLNFPHGGWIPEGEFFLDCPHLREMPTKSVDKCLERNVRDSDGTLIISRGIISADSDHARKMTLAHHRQLLGLDLERTEIQQAASLVHSWAELQKVNTLHVIGSPASEEPDISNQVRHMIKRVILLSIVQAPAENGFDLDPTHLFSEKLSSPPETIDQAVCLLAADLNLKTKVEISRMKKTDLSELNAIAGGQVLEFFSHCQGLYATCRNLTGKENPTKSLAVDVVLEALWSRLRETHGLKLIK